MPAPVPYRPTKWERQKPWPKTHPLQWAVGLPGLLVLCHGRRPRRVNLSTPRQSHTSAEFRRQEVSPCMSFAISDIATCRSCHPSFSRHSLNKSSILLRHESVLIPSDHATWKLKIKSCLERPRTTIQPHRFEFSASHLYLQASIFFAGHNMPGLAAHYRKDADSERQHGMQILEFVLKRGGGANSMVLNAIPKRT